MLLMARYPRLDLPLPLELVNTRFASGGKPLDALATPDDLDAWLRANAELFDADDLHVTSPMATPTLLERFRQLRAALHRLLAAVVDANLAPTGGSQDDLQLLNDLAAGAPRFPQLRLLDGVYRLHEADQADADTALLASVARAAMGLLAGSDVARLRRCTAPGCVLFFLRERRRREWCSDGCGNRARVARHYDQRRRAGVGPARSSSI
jgi:predicted RNA-binding Zn ribbon-like protein